ncbi:hypothetical protein AV530_018411 [Patagioenas fasciata monilis]|uniref:Uncharacterized protein n=1 Tax=Patagioenas fasciata monilis TaxID=372326 RepID=A0A1V4JRW2_PATFA|nr:hypothetical protein AV530_018411 [Patagioenas fasciata monilis]
MRSGKLQHKGAARRAGASGAGCPGRPRRSPARPSPDSRNPIKNRARDSPLHGLHGGAARQDGGTLHDICVAGDHRTLRAAEASGKRTNPLTGPAHALLTGHALPALTVAASTGLKRERKSCFSCDPDACGRRYRQRGPD